MNFSNNQSLESRLVNVNNSPNVGFLNPNFIVFIYMLVILLISNLSAAAIRGYRRSLTYLRINIILILNYYLVETFNTCASIAVK